MMILASLGRVSLHRRQEVGIGDHFSQSRVRDHDGDIECRGRMAGLEFGDSPHIQVDNVLILGH